MKHYTTYLLFMSISIEPLKSLLSNKKPLSLRTAVFYILNAFSVGSAKIMPFASEEMPT